MHWDEAVTQQQELDLARLRFEARRQADGPTREQIEKKWRTLGEGWKFAQRDAPLMALLDAWARTGGTLKDVATKYSEHQAAAMAYLLDFNLEAAATIKAMWPVWRTQSERIEGDRWYQVSEALRICSTVHHLHGIALRMRLNHDRLMLPPCVVVKRCDGTRIGAIANEEFQRQFAAGEWQLVERAAKRPESACPESLP